MKRYHFLIGLFIWGIIVLPLADSNAQWQPQSSSVQNDLFGVHFIDNSQGVVVGQNATIIQTTNGGSNWTEVQTGSPNDYVYKDVAYIDNQTGFIVGYKGGSYIIRKTNSGLNGWFDKKSGGSNGLNAIAFHGQNNGVAVGDGGLILLTEDGGDSFNKVNFGENFNLYGINVIGKLIYVVGQGGEIYKSNDLGNSWKQQTAPPSQDLHSVHFLDEQTGYAAGEAGVVLKTIDGGQNWATLNPGTSNDINAIFFPTESNGFVVGEEGVIASTDDEGSTWNNDIDGGNFKATLHGLHFPNSDIGFTVGNVDDFNTTEGMVKKYSSGTPVPGSTSKDAGLKLSTTSTSEPAIYLYADQALTPPFRLTFFSLTGKKIASSIVRTRHAKLDPPSPLNTVVVLYKITSEKGLLKTGKLQLR
jgi:photosystem II stability/assembly factor-like uncharacterized protein